LIYLWHEKEWTSQSKMVQPVGTEERADRRGKGRDLRLFVR
jgi:hypothetical protein